MERRKFMIGLGSAAAGSATLVGSGAFSSVNAERDLTVDVVGDESAYLGLKATSEYASGTEDGKLELNFAGGHDEVNGSGLNEDADSRFDDVFKITNQGSNDVTIYVNNPDPDGDPWDGVNEDPVGFYADKDFSAPLTADPDHAGTLPTLGSGESIDVSLIFWLIEHSGDDIPEQVSIVAEEV